MSSPYLNQLIKIAKEDLPQIAHDLTNASTIYTVQEAAKRAHNILTILLHHVILSDPSVAAAAQSAQAAAQRAQQALPPPPPGYRYARGQDGNVYMVPTAQSAGNPPVGHPPAAEHYPSQNPPSAPAVAPPLNMGLPLVTSPGVEPPNPGGNSSQVAEVTITPQGSRVRSPTGHVAVLPPGVQVDATFGMPSPQPVPVENYDRPMFVAPTAQPRRTTEGLSSDVVLPEGGGMTPEVAAALANRQGKAPMIDASGGARNITDESP